MEPITREEEVTHLARTFIFQRPGDSDHTGEDQHRVLTQAGHAQAMSVQQKLKERSLTPADVRFSPRALRAIQTIMLDDGDCHLLEALDIPKEGPDWEELQQFAKRLEFAHPSVWTERMEPFFKRLSARAADRMTPLLPSHGIIRVVGHVMFVNFLALHFLGDTPHPADRRLILEAFLKQGSCIILGHDGKVEILDP